MPRFAARSGPWWRPEAERLIMAQPIVCHVSSLPWPGAEELGPKKCGEELPNVWSCATNARGPGQSELVVKGTCTTKHSIGLLRGRGRGRGGDITSEMTFRWHQSYIFLLQKYWRTRKHQEMEHPQQVG